MYIQKILLVIIIAISTGSGIIAQWRHDAHFVMGYWSDVGYRDPIIKFATNDVQLEYNFLAFGFDVASSNISDKNGNLLFYFNGCDLANFRHELIENGTGFNPGQIATRNCPGNNGYTNGHQSSLVLPLDVDDKEFIILHHTLDYTFKNDSITFYGIPRYSMINMKANDGKGKVTIKNQIYLQDTTIGGGNLTAVRHANNKDWWILVLDNEGSNNYYKVLLSGRNLSLIENQRIGLPWQRIGGGQAGFSTDGRKYFRFSGFDGLSIMDFDRETGMFSNYRHMPTQQIGLFNGASFSPNGQFIYLGNGPSLVQVDTAEDVLVADTVAVWDGTATSWGQPAWFGYMQSGPDCRIYAATGFCIPYLHVIMQPDKKGIDCDVRQHMIELQVPTCNLPYFPNYRLGTDYDYCNPDIVVLSSSDEHLQPFQNEIRIYPNPASDNIKILGSEMQQIEIFDSQGKKQMHFDLNSVSEQDMDISSLEAGVYIVKVTFGQQAQVKIIKCIKII